MFKGSVTYTRGKELEFSNAENSFKDLFDYEFLYLLLSAFDRNEIVVSGEVLPEDPLRFVVEWISMDGEELDLPDARNLARYLRIDFSPTFTEAHLEDKNPA